jgi:hypothetical protein
MSRDLYSPYPTASDAAMARTNSNPNLNPNLDPNLNPNLGMANPYDGTPNPYLSYNVFDKPFLVRGVQSTSDPAAWLSGVFTYIGLRQQSQMAGKLPNEPWGPCSSYGCYDAAPNATLSNNRNGCMGVCVEGRYDK